MVTGEVGSRLLPEDGQGQPSSLDGFIRLALPGSVLVPCGLSMQISTVTREDGGRGML